MNCELHLFYLLFQLFFCFSNLWVIAMMINAGLLCLITTFLHGKVDLWDFLNLLTVFNGEAKNVEEPYQAMSSS